jgi:hypothetical protein
MALWPRLPRRWVVGVVEKKACPLCGQQLGPGELKVEPSTRFDDGWDVERRRGRILTGQVPSRDVREGRALQSGT